MSQFNGHEPQRVMAAILRTTVGERNVSMWEAHRRGESTHRLAEKYGVGQATAHRQVKRVDGIIQQIKSSLDRNS